MQQSRQSSFLNNARLQCWQNKSQSVSLVGHLNVICVVTTKWKAQEALLKRATAEHKIRTGLVSSFIGTKLWARRGKLLSWRNTERNWCCSGNWVSQSLRSQNQPASISIHHLFQLHQWVSKPFSSVSMFYTIRPLMQSGSSQQTCSCTKGTSRQQVSRPNSNPAPWPVMEIVLGMREKISFLSVWITKMINTIPNKTEGDVVEWTHHSIPQNLLHH